MSNPALVVKVKSNAEQIQVYKLTTGTPTPKHIWCEYRPDIKLIDLDRASRTFTNEELEFKTN